MAVKISLSQMEDRKCVLEEIKYAKKWHPKATFARGIMWTKGKVGREKSMENLLALHITFVE